MAAASAIDPQFAGLTLEPGLKIWRIESFEVVPVPEDHYGRFFEGDAYLVYAGIAKGSDVEAHVHFFLGKDCSQDESGAAALKAVELDQALGDAPIQHREVQNHESALFLSHFRSSGGVEYMPGGVASGFTHVEPETYEPRLLQIKGRRTVRTQQVELAASAMNNGDVFILDLGMKLFLWAGPESNRYEKAKGIEVMQRLDNSRGGKPERIVMADAGEEQAAEFWAALGGSEADVQDASAGGSDEETLASGAVTLARLEPAGDDSVTVTPVETGEAGPVRSQLESDGIFVVDAGNSVYVWIGSDAPAEQKSAALVMSQQYIAQQEGKPGWVSATVVRQHMEPAEMQGLFSVWNPHKAYDYGKPASTDEVAADLPQEALDYARMLAPMASEEPAADMSDASVRGYRVVDTDITELDADSIGEFFAGDSYIIVAEGSGGAILYFWLGRNSSQIEQGTAAVRCVSLSDEMGGSIPQVRVTQGREPPHFCALFKGGMVVHSDGAGGSLSEEEAAATSLYHVKGMRPSTTKAVQVAAQATNLNSGDCFVLVRGTEGVDCWHGSASSDEEQEVADAVAAKLAAKSGAEVTVVAEGSEEESFWEALGGKEEYPSASIDAAAPMPARLFQLSTETGTLRIDEVVNFAQEDLLEDDVMILDTFNQVFVWVGPGANETERGRATEVAAEYLAAAGSGRDPDVPIIVQHAGKETAMFTSNFQGWETSEATVFVDPYQAKLQRLREEEEARQAEREAADAAATAARAEAIAALEAGGDGDEEGEGAAAEEEGAEDGDDAEDGAEDGDAAEEAEPPAAEEEAPAAAEASASSSGVDDAEAARIRNSADDSETKARLEAAAAERDEALRKMVAKAEATMAPGDHTFTLEELQACKERTAEMDIDLKVKELYLADSDFAELFGMSKDEFSAQAAWKRNKAKKAHGLF